MWDTVSLVISCMLLLTLKRISISNYQRGLDNYSSFVTLFVILFQPNERVNYDSSSNKNSERQVCLLTSIPGLNSWEMLRRYGNLRENLETDESYEPSGKRVKLSEDAPQETQTPCDKCYIKVHIGQIF